MIFKFPMVDPNTVFNNLSNPSSHRLLKTLIFIALVLLIISILLLWFSAPTFSEKDVELTLDAPQQASSGDEITYTVKYKNNTKLTLHDMSFRFFYPEDAVISQNGQVASDTSDGFDVAELKPGESGEHKFTVFLIGDRGNIKDARVELIFSAGSLRSTFKKTASVSTAITGLPVPLTLVAPPSAVPGQPVTYILDYRNESGADISDLTFEFTFPDGFTFSSSTPAPSQKPNIWSIPTLKDGKGSRITINGVLSGNERDVKTVSVALKRSVNGQDLDYEKISSSTVISSPLLGLSVLINDSANYVSHAGDTLRYAIKYRNASGQTLTGLVLSVKLDGDMFDISTLAPREGFFDNASGTIIWNAGAAPELASLGPNRGGEVDFSIRLKQSFPSGLSGSRTFFVSATALLTTPNVPTGIDAADISAQTSVVTKISTQPVLTQLLYWNDPVFGSSGPFPPQVGKETVFTVHWQIVNPGNDMKNVQISATLPPGIVWKNIIGVGTGQSQPVYDKNKSQVTWFLASMLQGIGVTTDKYEASFQLGLTPSSTQVGNPVVLMKNVTLSGTDGFTGQAILVQASDITTGDTVDRTESGAVQQ